MGLIKRLSRVVRAKLNTLVSNAEDPVQQLDLKHEEMRDRVSEIEQARAEVKTEVKRLEIQRDNLRDEIDDLNEKARVAVNKGDEELARKFLNRKNGKMEQVETLTSRINELQNSVDEINSRRNELEQKLQEFKTKKEVKKAEFKAAEAQANAVESISDMGEFSAEDIMSDIESDIEEMEARSQALAEMNENNENETLDDKLRQTEVDDELQRLQEQEGVGTEDEELTAEVSTETSSMDVDEELEELKE